MINVLEYIDWAKIVARRWRGKGLSIDDLNSEAMIGLIKAKAGFNPKLGVRFELYAEYWIGREIRQAIVRNRTIKIPRIRYYEAKKYLKGKLNKHKLSKTKQELLVDAVYAYGMLRSGHEDVMEEIIDHFDAQSESFDRVLTTLQHLDPLESEVVQLKLGLDGRDELSFEKVTKTMGLNKGSSYYLYRKAMKKLRKMVESGEIQLRRTS